MAKFLLSEKQMLKLQMRLIEQYGASEEITAVQEALNKFFDKEDIKRKVPVDGLKNKQTEEGLQFFQQFHNIDDKDPYGKKTMEVLAGLGYLKKSMVDKVKDL
jgi:hypothetical protein